MFKFFVSKTAISFSFILSITFLLTGCPILDPKPEENLQCDLPSLGYTNTNQSDKLDISVNVDGSGSMLGYVAINNSNYIKTLDAIESVVDPNNQTSIEYKRIGDKNPLQRNQFLNDTKTKGFYDGSNPRYKRVSSPIQDSIEAPMGDNDKLTIIITDLEGDDGDYLSEKLREYYFNSEIRKKGYTVGVWGIKSQFQGNVYDPRTSRIKFVYNTQGRETEDYRPFYVLFIGKYEHIANYYNELETLHSNLTNDSEMFIFPANNIVKEAISLGSFDRREDQSELPENNQIDRLHTLDNNNITVYTQNEKIPYEFLEIIHQDETEIPIEYQVNIPVLTSKDKGGIYSLALDENQLRFKNKVFTFDPNANSNIQQSQSQPESDELENNLEQNPQSKNFFSENNSSNLQNILTIDNTKLDTNNQTLNFTANINLNNLPNSDIHLFEVDLILDNMQDPNWWKDWDYENSNQPSGSKTEKISILMNKLEQLSLDSIRDKNNNAVIGRLCFGIKKNI